MSLRRRSSRGQQDGPADKTRWNARPLVALALRVVMAGVPAFAAVAVAVFLERIAAAPTTWAARIVTWALLLGVSTIVALAVERRLRSLLPLALLMRMTLVFPDEAPSRYAVARAANSPAKIKELAAAGSSPRAQAAAEVLALVARLAKHDRHTRGHSERVRVFTDLIAEQMGVSGPDRDKLAWGALLHDIGKMTVPSTLLNKPGKPTKQEWDVLKGHPLAGAGFAEPLAEWLGPWIGGITEHHERFDGKGYPLGLAAHDITLAGRIVAVADAYETMTAARSYKKPMSVAAARQELTDCAGAHFDAAVVRAFLAVSLPRLMWGVGPLSFLVHLPFVVRAESLGAQLAAASTAAAPAAAAATVGAVSVVTAGAVGPAPVSPPPAQVTVADSASGHGSPVTPGHLGRGSLNTAPSQVSPTDLPASAATSQSVRLAENLAGTSSAPTASSTSRSEPSEESSTTAAPSGNSSSNGKDNSGNSGNSDSSAPSGNNGKGNGNAASTSNSGKSGSGNSGSSGSSGSAGSAGKGSSGNGNATVTLSSPGKGNSENGNSGKSANATPAPAAS